MMFVILMEVLHRLVEAAAMQGLLTASLYADDAVVFLKPTRKDRELMLQLLHTFGYASGLHTNIIQILTHHLACPLKEFQIQYVPLSIWKL